MTDSNKNYCIILCGGIGNRLWPCSRDTKPKQFLDLFGLGSTMLQLTYQRFARFMPKENIYISTFKKYESIVHKQLPNIKNDHIAVEPVQLGTAPSTALTAALIYRTCPDANVIVSPADQIIMKEEDFQKQVLLGLDFVQRTPNFVAMGVNPTRAETSYGYIQAGNNKIDNFFQVKSFTEKPNFSFAQLFCDSGEFYWSTGLFLWNIKTLLAALNQSHPSMVHLIEMINKGKKREDLLEFIADQYPRNLYQAIDMLILEHNTNVYVQHCSFGWADVGGWNNLYDMSQKDKQGNVILESGTELYNSHNNIICMPHNKVLLAEGLENYIIADGGDVLVICPKDDPAMLRRMMTDAIMKYGNKLS